MSILKCMIALISFGFSYQVFAGPQSGKYFDRAIFVIFENTNYSKAIQQPFLNELANRGAHFTDFRAVTHPSQPNYIAFTSGSLNGVSSNNPVNLNVANIADLLEAKGRTWKAYVEDYPGNCYTGASKLGYARKHNPFISYLSIQKDPVRCASIVNADQFEQDAANGSLPDYAFYVPNSKNSGHDTGVPYADRWYSQKFSRYVNDPRFMESTVLISTFDENGGGGKNQIYTSIVGPNVRPGIVSETLNFYSLLGLVEENWDLGNLGKEDVTAPVIPNIWQ